MRARTPRLFEAKRITKRKEINDKKKNEKERIQTGKQDSTRRKKVNKRDEESHEKDERLLKVKNRDQFPTCFFLSCPKRINSDDEIC